MARRKRYNRRRRQGSLSFFYKLLTMVLICAAVSVALALFFKVETIRVTGCKRYDPQEVLDASGIQVGSNLYFINKYESADTIIAALPYLETVQIRRELPNTLVITVQECNAPVGIAQDGKLWLLSGSGKVVDCVSTLNSADYTTVIGLELDAPEVGRPIVAAAEKVDACNALLSLLEQLNSHHMLPDVSTIDLNVSGQISMRYLNRFTVVLLQNTDFSYKMDYLLAVITRLEVNEIGTIDMTLEDTASFIPQIKTASTAPAPAISTPSDATQTDLPE